MGWGHAGLRVSLLLASGAAAFASPSAVLAGAGNRLDPPPSVAVTSLPVPQTSLPVAQPSLPVSQPSLPVPQPSLPVSPPTLPVAQPTPPAPLPTLSAVPPSSLLPAVNPPNADPAPASPPPSLIVGIPPTTSGRPEPGPEPQPASASAAASAPAAPRSQPAAGATTAGAAGPATSTSAVPGALPREEQARLSLGFTRLPVPRAFTPEVVALMLVTLVGLLVLAAILAWRGRQHRRELLMLNEAKQELLRLASHEFRTPLSVLTGYVSMLDQGDLGPVSPQLAAALPVLAEKTRAMEAMIEKMLDASRAVSAELDFRPKRIELAEAVRRSLGRLAALGAPERLDLVVAPEPVWVEADERILAGAIANLIENALKYSDGVVHCRVEAASGRACVEVIDTGPGISEEQMGRLFGLFGRVPLGRFSHVSGAGVGLYLADRMARLHRGRIRVESELGRGSSFRLELPLARSAGRPAPPDPAPAPAPASAAGVMSSAVSKADG